MCKYYIQKMFCWPPKLQNSVKINGFCLLFLWNQVFPWVSNVSFWCVCPLGQAKQLGTFKVYSVCWLTRDRDLLSDTLWYVLKCQAYLSHVYASIYMIWAIDGLSKYVKSCILCKNVGSLEKARFASFLSYFAKFYGICAH